MRGDFHVLWFVFRGHASLITQALTQSNKAINPLIVSVLYTKSLLGKKIQLSGPREAARASAYLGIHKSTSSKFRPTIRKLIF